MAAVVITMPSYPAPRDAACGSFRGRAARRPGARLHAEPPVLGLAAAFPRPTPSGHCGRRARSRPIVGRASRPVGDRRSPRDPRRPRRLRGLFDGRPHGVAHGHHPSGARRPARVGERHGRHRGPRRTARPSASATTNSRRRSSATASMRSSRGGSTSPSSRPFRPTRETTTPGVRTPSRASPRACGSPGRARRSHCGTACPPSRCLFSSSAAPSTRASRHTPRGWRR